MLERTYEYRLYPTRKQERNFNLLLDTTRALYNGMLKDRTEHFRETGKWQRLNPEPIIKESLLMKELEASVVSWTVGNLERAFINFFRIRKTQINHYRPEAIRKAKKDPSYVLMDTDLAGYPKMKNKTAKGSIDMGSGKVLVTADRVNVPGVGNIKIRLHRPIPEKATIRHYTIVRKAAYEYYFLVHIEMPEPEKITELKSAMGIALEPGVLAQCSDGKPVLFRHESNAMKGKIARAYAKLQIKTPGSRQYEKQRLHLAVLNEKQKMQRRDSLHKISKRLVSKADYIILEEPRVQQKKKKLLRAGTFDTVLDEAWWTFSEYIRYKSCSAGKRFWRASGDIPIRNACSSCGIILENIEHNTKWECPYCGVRMPAELNAAKNLEHFGSLYIQEQ